MPCSKLLPAMALVCAAAGLVGCDYSPASRVPPELAPTQVLGECCKTLEVYPPGLISMIEPKAGDKDTLSTPHRMRTAYLVDRPEARDFVLPHLRPMDILTTSDKGLLTGRLMPGYFTHSLVYLGTPEQLRAQGLWDTPALRPHHARLRAGEVFYESVPDKVGFADAARVFDVDAVAVFRPRITTAQKRAALTRLMSQLGKPFDIRMDSSTLDCLYCAELLDYGFPFLEFPKITAYGRPVLPPDGIAGHGLQSDHMDFVGFVFGRPNKVVSATQTELAATLRKHAPGPD